MAEFTIEEINRYSRQLMLDDIGIEGQLKLKRAKILVVGAGGLGCPAIQYLSAAGVGTIGIIDFDKVEIHNLHRQILFNADDVGKYKAPAAAQKIKQLNPNVNCIVFNERLQPSNAENILSPFDLVVDGSDNFLTRYLVNDICVQLNKPLVYGSILRFEGQLAVFNYKGSKNLRDIFPEPPPPGEVPNCSEIGVLGIVPGIIGLMLGDHVLKIILELNVSTNALFLFDFKNYVLKKLTY